MPFYHSRLTLLFAVAWAGIERRVERAEGLSLARAATADGTGASPTARPVAEDTARP